jgi:hypothetical protein
VRVQVGVTVVVRRVRILFRVFFVFVFVLFLFLTPGGEGVLIDVVLFSRIMSCVSPFPYLTFPLFRAIIKNTNFGSASPFFPLLRTVILHQLKQNGYPSHLKSSKPLQTHSPPPHPLGRAATDITIIRTSRVSRGITARRGRGRGKVDQIRDRALLLGMGAKEAGGRAVSTLGVTRQCNRGHHLRARIRGYRVGRGACRAVRNLVGAVERKGGGYLWMMWVQCSRW